MAHMDMRMAMELAMDMGMDWAAVEAEAETTGTPAVCVVCMAAAARAEETGADMPPECAGGCMLDGGDGPDGSAPTPGIDMDTAARYWVAVGMEAPGETVDDIRRWADTPEEAALDRAEAMAAELEDAGLAELAEMALELAEAARRQAAELEEAGAMG